MVDRSRLKQWFHKNEFFTATPLNGWQFVYAATSGAEVVFWYAIITILMILTIVNVQQVTLHYLSEPVSYKVTINPTTENVHVPDTINFDLHIPIFDWLPHLPLQAPSSKISSIEKRSKQLSGENGRFGILYDLLCQEDDAQPLGSYLAHLTKYLFKLPEHFDPFYYETVRVDRSARLADFANPATMSKWKSEMKTSKDDYFKYWVEVLSTPVSRQNKTAIKNRLTQLEDVWITRQGMDTLVKLFSLKSIETGMPSVPAQLGLMKDDLVQREHNLTVAHLLKDTVSNLANMIHFEMEPRGTIALTNWDYYRTINYNEMLFDDGHQWQKYSFVMKPTTQSGHVKLRVYLRPLMWLHHVLQALEAVIEHFDLDTIRCDMRGLSSMVHRVLKAWIAAFQLSSISMFDSMSGSQLGTHTYAKESKALTLVPYMTYNSNIEGCYDGSFEDCRTRCVRDDSIAECGCLPWTSANLLNSDQWQTDGICEKYCETGHITQQCDIECAHTIENLCRLQVLVAHEGDVLLSYLNQSVENEQLMGINITIPEGKTMLLMKTLENASKMYNPVPKRVFMIYSCEQGNYPKLKQKLCDQGIVCRFIKGNAVTEDDLSEMADPNGGQTLIVIDDNSVKAASSKEMAHVFTIARHKNCSIVLLLHFVFGPWPSNRIILSNTSYIFLLKSPRMAQQVATLGSQIGKRDALVSAYTRESRKTYGYVLLDLRTITPENKRLCTDIFKDIDQSITEELKDSKIRAEFIGQPDQTAAAPPAKKAKKQSAPKIPKKKTLVWKKWR